MNNAGKHSLDVTELRVAVTEILKSLDPHKPSTIEGEIGIKREQLVIPCETTNGIRGRLIFELGGIPEREMKKFREEGGRLGKTSHAFAFYLDQQKGSSHKILVTHEMLFSKKQQKRNQNGAYSKAVRELERRKISKKGHGQNSGSMKTVAVFCSADDKISQKYKDEAHALGARLAERDCNLVTGGSKTGLMKEVVDGFLTKGVAEQVTGVLPKVLKELNVHHEEIPILHWVDGMHERLKTFHSLAQAIIVLPGGFGTMHELLDFLVSNQFGITSQKIILLNTDGFWDFLLKQFEVMQESNILATKHRNLLQVATSIDHALSLLGTQQVTAGLSDKYWETNQVLIDATRATETLHGTLANTASTTMPQQPQGLEVAPIDTAQLVGDFWREAEKDKGLGK